MGDISPSLDNCELSFAQWASKAGLVTEQAEFVDVYGLDGDVC